MTSAPAEGDDAVVAAALDGERQRREAVEAVADAQHAADRSHADDRPATDGGLPDLFAPQHGHEHQPGGYTAP